MILMLSGLFCLYSSLWGQPGGGGDKRVTLSAKGISIENLFKEVYKQTGLAFVYNVKDVRFLKKVDVDVKEQPVSVLMNRVLTPLRVSYEITENSIIIKMKGYHVKGKVIDKQTGETLIGASVRDKKSGHGVATDTDGNYEISVNEGATLVVSYMGFLPLEKRITAEKDEVSNFALTPDEHQLDEVVVTGIVNRKASSFTGSISSFNTADLAKVGSQNVIKSLEVLEPALFQVTNLAVGSNPNALPTLELNGTSSFSDVTNKYTGNPNQPLFILNGFESSLQTILDLDMNLIKSVTVLKDASAKAIYGSKASNGVIIVETKRPEAGKLQIYYSGSVSLEVPDLTSYNLANSAEKLQAELLSEQVYTDAINPMDEVKNNTIYNELYKEMMRGVDTYWLSAPLRTGVGQKHTLSVDGGNDSYIYGINLSYNKVNGAMKNSDRSTLQGSMTLEYRIKNLVIRDNLFVAYNDQHNPYYSFDDYAGLNPYWRKTDKDGNIVKTFVSTRDGIYNPLWNDQWKTYDKTNYTEITNNVDVDWTILPALRLVGRFNLTKNNTQSDVFKSPFLTEFDTSDEDEKGSYMKSNSNSFTMGGDLNLSYSHVTKEKHIFFYNLGTSFQTSNDENYAFSAYGFPNETDFLYFARGYKADDKPSAGESKARELSFLGIFNYSFMDRYLLDASLRTTGSSQFGRDKRWGNFWSVGLGWNIQNEPFIKDHEIGRIINLLKLRASIGYSGSQNFNAYQAIPTYEYYPNYYYNGVNGAYLQAFPNTKLQWQEKFDKNIGLDLTLWEKLNLTFNYYMATTKNSISQLTVAPSVGFTSYAENIGDIENKGFDLNLNYLVFNIPATRSYLSLNFTIASNTNRIKKISDALKKYNETMDADKEGESSMASGDRDKLTRPAPRYVEGRSMTAIWGVQSAGIDPLTGKEVFIRPNGERTFEWSTNDQVVIGDSRPKVHGTFGFNFEWKGFSLNTVCSYQMGGDYYNTTLVDKVENADIFKNVDLRYLTDRWKTAGDVAYFKSIANADYTKPTSRFIMKNNELVISNINVGYDFRYFPFVKKLGFTSFKLMAYVNNVATLSTVKQERGTDYPFARNMNFALSFNF